MSGRILRRIRELLDVDATNQADGKSLVYRSASGKHEYETVSGGSSTLAGLSDVSGGPPASGEAPVWDGDSFELTNVATQAELDALSGVYQPLDSDLTAIAALSTTAFGRGLLELANAAALLSAAGAAAAAHTHAQADVTNLTADLAAKIAMSLIDAKGDLVVGTADDTVARKAVGTNGTTLGADSSQSDGLAWVNRLAVTGYVTGNYYPLPNGTLGTVTPTLGHLRAYPIVVTKRQTFDRIAIDQSGSGVASLVARLGIYADAGTGHPGALVLDAGTVDLSTAAALKTITISLTLDPGVYWLAATLYGGASATAVRNMANQPWKWIMATAVPTNYGFSVTETKYVSGVTGTLPNPFGSPTDAGLNTSVAVYLRAA